MGGIFTHMLGVNAAGGAVTSDVTLSAVTVGVDSDTDAASYTYTASGLPAGDKIILVFVWGERAFAQTTTITGVTAESGAVDGDEICNSGTERTPFAVYSIAGVTGTSTEITATFSNDQVSAMVAHAVITNTRAISYHDRSGATPDQLSANTVTSTALTIPTGGVGIAVARVTEDSNQAWSQDAGSGSEDIDQDIGTGGFRGSIYHTTDSAATTFTISGGITSRAVCAFSWEAGNPHVGISGTPVTSVVAGENYSVTFAGYDGYTPYSYSVSAGSLPPGLSLNASTGELIGIPNTAGTYSGISIRATDDNGWTADSPAFAITVTSSGSGDSFDSALITFDSSTHTMDEN